MTPDWTVPIDDGLRHLPEACTACGTKAGGGFFDLWQSDDGLVIAVIQCTRCKAEDEDKTQLRHRLAERYGGTP